MLKCKETVNSVFVDEEVPFSLYTDNREYKRSHFCDPHHKHVITENLHIIDNSKLRKLIINGPHYREPRAFHFTKPFRDMKSAIENYSKTSLRFLWNLFRATTKTSLTKEKSKQTKPLSNKTYLCNPEVKAYSESRHKRSVIIRIVKAANYFTLICKRFYIDLLSEVQKIDNSNTKTY